MGGTGPVGGVHVLQQSHVFRDVVTVHMQHAEPGPAQVTGNPTVPSGAHHPRQEPVRRLVGERTRR